MPLNIDLQQILLHMLNFLLLAGGLYILLYKPVKKFMAQREEHYRLLDEEQRRRVEQAAALEDEYRRRLENAEAEIAEKQLAAKKQCDDMQAEEMAQSRLRAEKLLQEAREAAEQEHRRIVGEAQQEIIADLSGVLAEKLLAQSTSAAFEQFLQAAERNTAADGERGEADGQ